MGINYTANVYYGEEITYRHICTEEGIYKDYFDEWKSSGFLFGENGYAYYFDIEDGKVVKDDEPYTDIYGNPYTKDYVIEQDYQVTSLEAEYFTKISENIYEAKPEYLYQLSRNLIGEPDPESITLTIESGLIQSIEIDNFYDDYLGELDSCQIVFTDIGTSVLDLEIDTTPSFIDQLPPMNDPSKPVSTEVSDIGKMLTPDAYVLPEDTSGGENPGLKTALDEAKTGVSYHLEDYFDDTVNKDTQYWEPSTRERDFYIDGYSIYIDDSSSGNQYCYTLVDGETYRVDTDGVYSTFVKRDGDYNEITAGGNIFEELSPEMFTLEDDGTYKGKEEYYDLFDEVFSLAGRGKGYFYQGNPSTYISDVTLSLEDGRISNLTMDRYFAFGDGDDDLQTLTITVLDVSHPMPFEDDYLTQDQKALRDAILKTGNNYTVDYTYYDDTYRKEYYGDRVIYKDYGFDWASSGFVYVNDYAYYFDIDEGIVNVDDEPYELGGQIYYRDYMNKGYLPLVQIDPSHFTLKGDSYVADDVALQELNSIFFDEDSPISLTLTLTSDGLVSQIVLSCEGWGGEDDTCTADIVDVGSTEYVG